MIIDISKQTWIRSSIVSVVCLIIFILLNFVLSGSATTPENSKKVTKTDAIEIASDFITTQTSAAISKHGIIYNSPKEYTGYIAKYESVDEHYKQIDHVLPAESYRVFAQLEGIDTDVYVDINFMTGDVVGWSFPLSDQLSVDEASKALALDTLANNSFPMDGIEIETSPDGTFIATNEGRLSIEEASVDVHIEVVNIEGKPFVTSYQPEVSVPADYIAETTKQDKLANKYTTWGFIVMSIIFAILAIIYAVIYRHFTSFKYGIAFTVVATILSCITQISMMKPNLMMQSNSMVDDPFMLIFTSVILVIIVCGMAASYYFSFVAGDGLWKKQGFNLWPRFKDKSFGQVVWNSMLIGFLFALSGLGIQAIIFEGLSFVIGTYSAVDATQSPLNSTMLWFFPALAWVAAISEEAVFRYFGVGIFRRWFKNTYVAAIIPSLVWAFGHTLYPLYPVSTRIIELLIIGILLTWVMVKFGLLAVIFTHAIFNSIAMSMSLFSYGDTFDMVMSVVYVVGPLLVAYIIKVAHARYIRNRPEPPQAPPVHPQHYEPYQPQFPQQ